MRRHKSSKSKSYPESLCVYVASISVNVVRISRKGLAVCLKAIFISLFFEELGTKKNARASSKILHVMAR